jgi:DNA-binding transcriptional regulator YdaS (Cro superfamily)
MTKSEIIRLAGSQDALAKILGISQGAVSQWGESIPKGRYWQLMVLKPEWFVV